MNSIFNQANEIWLNDAKLGYKPEQQIKAAKSVISKLKKSHYCRLQAQMQSGKTGVVGITCAVALKSRMFDRIIFITAESSVNLKEQNLSDIFSTLSAYGIQDLDEVFEVYHRGQFFKKSISKKLISPKNKEKVLLILDEAHSGVIKNGVLDLVKSFLNVDFYKKTNTKILTVSATPFPESLVAKLQKISPVQLEVSNKYLGVEKMIQLGLVKQSEKAYDEEVGLSPILLDVLNEFKKSKKQTCIIRSTELSNNVEVLYNYVNKNDFHVEVVDQHKEDELDYYVSNKANKSKKTIILLKQKGRVGVQIRTDKLHFVWDSPKQKTSTTAQSLLGRVCGYGKNNSNVKVFTDLEQAKNYVKWLKGELTDISYTLGKSRTEDMKDYRIYLTKDTFVKHKSKFAGDLASRNISQYQQDAGRESYKKMIKALRNLKPKKMSPLGLQQGGAKKKQNFFIPLQSNYTGQIKKIENILTKLGYIGMVAEHIGYKKVPVISGKKSMYEK